MKKLPTNEPYMLIEVGRLLKLARTQQDFSMEDMCKKMGMRVEQIQAVESGNAAFFPNTAQPFMWFARLYARKLGVDLPVLVFNSSQGTKRTISGAPQEIPPFLINKKTDSEND
jgi:transcriptional regulator with XRE-family HTH domain